MGNLSHKNQNLNLSLKISAAMSDFVPSLPQDLNTEILSRLPAESIGQSRSVSSPWRELLSDPQFIRAHHTRHIHDREKLILIDTYHSPHIVNFTVDTDSTGSSSINDGVSRKVCQTSQYNKWAKVKGSCHGLVLVVVMGENTWLLINPTTSETNFCLASDPIISSSACGLGYDCSNYDCKIVALSYNDTDNEHEPDDTDTDTDTDDEHEPDDTDNEHEPDDTGTDTDNEHEPDDTDTDNEHEPDDTDNEHEPEPKPAETFVDIYSVKMKTWRRLENSPYDHTVHHSASSGIFLNDAIHFLARDCRTTPPSRSPSVIAAFNLARENFDDVPLPLPKDLEGDKFFMFYELKVIGGRLAVYTGDNVWLMEEYGKQDSWKRISLPRQDYCSFKPICLLSDVEMVLAKNDVKEAGMVLVLYNIEEETSRNMVIAGIPVNFKHGTFTESLLSPNFR